MSCLICKIPGIGEVALEAFNRAGYICVRDLYAFHLGDVAGDRRLMQAIQDMRNEAGDDAFPGKYYRALGTRCANIVNRVLNARALPYAPDHFLCRISLELMQDPVITPSGYTYERTHIEEWIDKNPRDPFTRSSLTKAQLYPNRALRDAIQHYRQNFQSFFISKVFL